MFFYELAFTLGQPVHVLQSTMPYDEMLKWQAYFEIRPVGWREDLRTSHLLRIQNNKIDPMAMFPSLRAVQAGTKAKTVAESLVGSDFFSKMMNATGGETLEFLKDVK